MSDFRLPVRVYYEDTDAGGVVYHTGYIRFFERARTEWLRSLGFSQQQLTQEAGVLFTVVDLTVRYVKPARLDDLLDVSARPHLAGGASMAFEQEIRNAAGELLAAAEVRVACVRAGSLRPCRLPAAIAARLPQ